MTNTKKDLTKAELKELVKAAYQEYMDAGAIYREMRESYHAPAHKLDSYNATSRRSHTVGFTLHYHGRQKNDHFSKTELAQTYLDLVGCTQTMWEEIAEAAAATVK